MSSFSSYGNLYEVDMRLVCNFKSCYCSICSNHDCVFKLEAVRIVILWGGIQSIAESSVDSSWVTGTETTLTHGGEQWRGLSKTCISFNTLENVPKHFQYNLFILHSSLDNSYARRNKHEFLLGGLLETLWGMKFSLRKESKIRTFLLSEGRGEIIL